MRRARKGTPTSSPAQNRPLCQGRGWQQYHPTRDVAESLSAAPSLIVSGTGLSPQNLGRFGGGTPCAPHLGALVVALLLQEGSEGLGGSRRGCKDQGPHQGSAQRSPKKERGEKQGKAGEKSSCRVRAGSESQGQSWAALAACVPCVLMETEAMPSSLAVFSVIFKGSSCLRGGAFRQPLPGEEQGSAGARRESSPWAALSGPALSNRDGGGAP